MTARATCLVLSLFPGIGLLDMAFEAEGFCVVRGPDVLWGGDVRVFHPPAGRFDGVIGGPPCQRFSTAARRVPEERRAENLIPEFERCVSEAQPAWWLMEQVRDAPIPAVQGYVTWSTLLDAVQCGSDQWRLRRFSFGSRDGKALPIETRALWPVERVPTVTAAEAGRQAAPRAKWRRKNGELVDRTRRPARTLRHCIQLQGLPADFDIPPFTRRALGEAVGNGVPLPMGRALAKAVRKAVAP